MNKRVILVVTLAAIATAITMLCLRPAHTLHQPSPSATNPQVDYIDLVASVNSEATLGDGLYYTADGAVIVTPPRSAQLRGEVYRSVNAAQQVILREEGIRVVGRMALDDFKTALAAVVAYESASAESSALVRHTNHAGHLLLFEPGADFSELSEIQCTRQIKVIAPDVLEVERITRLGVHTRANPLGHSAWETLRLHKANGRWSVSSFGTLVE